MAFCWIGWREADGTPFSMAIPMMPAIMLGSKNASTAFDALFGGSWPKFVQRFVDNMHSRTQIPFELRESDKGGQCDKLTSHEPTTYVSRPINPESKSVGDIAKLKVASYTFTLYWRHFCNLHQGQLDIGALAKQHWMGVIAGKYAMSGVMNSGSFWMRATLSIQVLLDEPGNFTVVNYPPSQRLRCLMQTRLFSIATRV